MYLPDYKGGSIVNLMSSIGNALGAEMPYENLKILPPEELRDSKNIVLVVLDGLSYEYLMKKSSSFLKEHTKGMITSVFPSTTSAAITTFATGLGPQQHAITGWYMFLKEIGVVSTILRFCPRMGGHLFSEYGYEMKDFLDAEMFQKRIKTKSFFIINKELLTTDYTKIISKGTNKEGHQSIDVLFSKIKKSIKSGNKKKYIYAYWPDVDSLGHEYGVGSRKYEKHIKDLDKKIKRFASQIKNTNTTLILTADHGQINLEEEKVIKLEKHPKLKECLIMPLSGEKRAAYCYVHPAKTKDFEDYVNTNLSHACWMYKSQELIDKGWFGLGDLNPKLIDRIGDYVLVMKENYALRDKIDKMRKKAKVKYGADHGGVSKEEMFVPLIVIKC